MLAKGLGTIAPPPPYYSLANPAFVAATGGFQVGAKLEAVDGIGSTEAGKQLICVATIKAAAADRVLISFDGVGRLKRASFLACVCACVCARAHVYGGWLSLYEGGFQCRLSVRCALNNTLKRKRGRVHVILSYRRILSIQQL